MFQSVHNNYSTNTSIATQGYFNHYRNSQFPSHLTILFLSDLPWGRYSGLIRYLRDGEVRMRPNSPHLSPKRVGFSLDIKKIKVSVIITSTFLQSSCICHKFRQTAVILWKWTENIILCRNLDYAFCEPRDYQGKRTKPPWMIMNMGRTLWYSEFFSAYATRASRGCFRGGFGYVSFLFVSKRWKTSLRNCGSRFIHTEQLNER